MERFDEFLTIVIRIRLPFLRSAIPLLLAFTGLACISFSFFTSEIIKQEISSESISDISERLPDLNNAVGDDDDSGNGDNFLNQPTYLFYPLSANEKKNTILSMQSFIALYLLYHRLVFYYPVFA